MNGRMWSAAALAAVVFASGCCHWCRRPCPPRTVVQPLPSVPGCPAPCPPAGGPLPPRVQPAPVPPIPEPPAPSATPLAPSLPPSARGQGGEDFVWRPSQDPPNARLTPPDLVPSLPDRESAKLMPPESVRPSPPARIPPPDLPDTSSDTGPLPKPPESSEPPLVPERPVKPPEPPADPTPPTTPPMMVPSLPPARPGVKEETNPLPPKPGVKEEPATLPVDIPQFAVAKKDVASGLKPYPDGLDWLKAKGYRTVLHVRAPGEDDSADRKQVEKRGLKYLSLEVSPETLSRELLDRFNRLVGEPGNLPLFVYDKDGMVAGGLWYLHFRSIESASDEDARSRASRLGIKVDQDGDHRAMWLAVQKVLSKLKRD